MDLGNLTQRQYQILKYIYQTMKNESRPPTLRELGEQFSISSTKGVSDHLDALERKGWIKREKWQSRGIQLVKGKIEKLFWAQVGIPLVGKVAAGEPILAVENIEGTLDLRDMFPSSSDLFALRVKGDSMIQAGIHKDDILVVKEQPTADLGDIVVAIIKDEEGTVKKLSKVGKEIHLKPANPAYETIIKPMTEVEIRGKVIGVIRRMAG